MVLATWDYLLSRFSPCRTDFLTVFASDERYADVLLTDVAKLMQNPKMTLREFLDTDKVCLQRIAYNSLSPTAQLLFYGKCGNATRLTVGNTGVSIEGIGLSPIVTAGSRRHNYNDYEILLKCDDWSGRFSEYDLVTDFWPVIPPRLFNCLMKTQHERPKKLAASERAIEIYRMGNGISALGEQDPCMVHPRFGLYQEEHKHWRKDADVCKVGSFERASTNYWLFEINDYYKNREDSVRYILYMFISPRALSAKEEHRLKEFELSDPEYVKGVREGWSLLFLGHKHTIPIMRSGITARDEIVRTITSDIWTKLEGEEYHFLDGTHLLNL
jgi:molecular chaperone HtpG